MAFLAHPHDVAGVVPAVFRRLDPTGAVRQQVAGHHVGAPHQQPVAIHPGHRLQSMLDPGKQPADRTDPLISRSFSASTGLVSVAP